LLRTSARTSSVVTGAAMGLPLGGKAGDGWGGFGRWGVWARGDSTTGNWSLAHDSSAVRKKNARGAVNSKTPRAGRSASAALRRGRAPAPTGKVPARAPTGPGR